MIDSKSHKNKTIYQETIYFGDRWTDDYKTNKAATTYIYISSS